MQEITLLIEAEIEPVVKRFHSESIFLKRVRKEKGGGFSVTINKKDSEKSFAILKKMCYNYIVVKVKSIASFYAYFGKRAGLLFGSALIAGLAFILSLFSFKIEITGLNRLDEDRVRTVLNNGGLSEWSLRKNFTGENVRSALAPLEDVLDVTVKSNGGRVLINIIERAEFSEPFESDNDIVSRFDCVVTKISAAKGQALFKPGSIIKKGTPVIGAYTTDSNGNKIKTKASGEVYGNVVFSKRTIVPAIVNKRERTGKTYISTDVLFRDFIFMKGKTPGFEDYDKETSIVCAFKNNFLPLYFKKTIYFEVKTNDYETDENALAEQSLQEFYTFTIAGEKVNSEKKWFKITEAEGLKIIDLFVEAEILVN